MVIYFVFFLGNATSIVKRRAKFWAFALLLMNLQLLLIHAITIIEHFRTFEKVCKTDCVLQKSYLYDTIIRV